MTEPSYYVRDRGNVTGPRTLEQMLILVKRGAVSRITSVSTDLEEPRAWGPASRFPELFPSRERGGGSGSRGAGAKEPEPAVWHYVLNGNDYAGPITASDLKGQIRGGRLAPDVLVWREGVDNWRPATSFPELSVPVVAPAPAPSPAHYVSDDKKAGGGIGFGTVIAVCALCVLLTTGVVFGLVQSGVLAPSGPPRPNDDLAGPPGGGTGAPAPGVGGNPAPGGGEPAQPADPHLISSLDDQKKLDQAVGMVVCGWTVRWIDGDVEEIQKSSGSCFAVAPDGYLVTNKHVIEFMESRLRMEKSFKIKDYCGYHLAPVKTLLDEMKKQKVTADNELKEKIARKISRYTESNYQSVEPKIWVFLGSREELYEAEIVKVSNFDMSVLKVRRKEGPYFPMADEAQLPRSRTKVYALGFPGAAMEAVNNEEQQLRTQRIIKNLSRVQDQFRSDDFNLTSTAGEVSRIAGEAQNGQRIQHDADIKHGNSGGPLVTPSGTVVGINTWGVKGDADPSGIYYALAIPQLKREITKAIESHRGGK